MTTPAIRKLTPADADMLYRHYNDLDPESKRCRFSVQISERALRQFLGGLDLNRDIHFAIIDGNDILALAQVSQYDNENKFRRELGLSVASKARRLGYANLLWDSVTAYVQQENMQELYILHSPQNYPMLNFCRSKGLRSEYQSGERIGVWKNPDWIDPHIGIGYDATEAYPSM